MLEEYGGFTLEKLLVKMHGNYEPDLTFLNFRTDSSGQTVQSQIRLLDQGLHCLLFQLHH